MVRKMLFSTLLLSAVWIAGLCSSAYGFSTAASGYCPTPPAIPICNPPIVPMFHCCEPSPLFPPAPPLVAPVIAGMPSVCHPFFGPPVAPSTMKIKHPR